MRYPWPVIRMLVESATGRDAMDLTWIRIKDVLRYRWLFKQLDSGRPFSPAQEAELHRISKAEAGNDQ